jgi:hypothetical protein
MRMDNRRASEHFIIFIRFNLKSHSLLICPETVFSVLLTFFLDISISNMAAVAATPSDLDFDAFEGALLGLLARDDFPPGVSVKKVRKELEKVLKMPKKSLKGSDTEIAGHIEVRGGRGRGMLDLIIFLV